MTRTTAVLLCAVMLVLFCAGCSRRRPPIDDNGETTPTPVEENNGATELVEDPDANPTIPVPSITGVNPDDVIDPDDIVDTYNVVLVLDTSGSMEKSDQYGLALQQAPKMFLESMYAGNASQDRMKGAKKANLNIITYNDTVRPIYSQLYSLDDPGTVDGLNDALSKINEQDTFGTHDTALGDALEQAVQMLPTSIRSPGGPPPGAPAGPGGVSAGGPGAPGFGGPPPGPFGGQEQNLIILFTDGYSAGGASPASFGRDNTDAYTGQTPVRRVSSDLNTPDNPQTAFPEPVMPYFGGKTQEPLERALIAAKQRQCEIIVLGLNTDGNAVVSNFPCTGMHGGKLFLRSDCQNVLFPPQVTPRPATQEDMAEIIPYLREYCELFDCNFDEIIDAAFTVITPDSANPYKQMYVAN